MRITRVSTMTGDGGTTRLVGGQEVWKNDPRVEAYGTVEELNSSLGFARAAVARGCGPEADLSRVQKVLLTVQNDLFSLSGSLACLPADRTAGMVGVTEADVARLQEILEVMNHDLPPLQEFVLPGGDLATASIHQARTTCRRAERRVAALLGGEPGASGDDGDRLALRYLNRLGDLLFVLARWAGRAMGEEEICWRRR